MSCILVLDDDYAVRQSFADYFEDNLWDVLQAESAEQALELLETQKVDAAIVDIRLPGMDGYDFIREANKNHPNLVSVICTGSPEYYMPPDLKQVDVVSNNVFGKPVKDLGALKDEVISIMDSDKKK